MRRERPSPLCTGRRIGALVSVTGVFDYSGICSYPMFLKWNRLSKTAETAPLLINLVWTDIMANYVMGARSQLSRPGLD